MLGPHHRNPLSREEDMPPPPPLISGIGYHWQLQKNIPFSWYSREIYPRLRPEKKLSRENENMHAAPSCIRWGGGGGVVTFSSSDSGQKQGPKKKNPPKK